MSEQHTILDGRYELLRRIGQGGMASVHEALDRHSQSHVAVKILPTAAGHPSHAARFQREIQAVARMRHKGVVPVLDYGVTDGQTYYVMPLIDGWPMSAIIGQLCNEVGAARAFTSLPELLQHAAPAHERENGAARTDVETAAPGAVPQRAEAASQSPDNARVAPGTTPAAIQTSGYVREMVRLVRDAARALAHAHECGVVHRDIKPDNLLIDQQARVHVTDFGVADIIGEQTLTLAGELLGTPRYMSPEQIAAGRVPIDTRTDVYSLATVLYELLTLVPPHDSATRHGLLQAIAVKQPVPVHHRNTAVPRDLAAVVQQALAKDPDGRYTTMAEFADDLDRVLDGTGVVARPADSVGRARRARIGIATSVAVLLLLAAGWVARTNWRQVSVDAGVVTPAARFSAATSLMHVRDWDAALHKLVGALPPGRNDRMAIAARFAMARSPQAIDVVSYVGPGSRVAIAADESAMVCCDAPHIARVYRNESENDAAARRRLEHSPTDLIQCVRFSKDDQRILTVGLAEVRIWSWLGRPIVRIEASDGWQIAGATCSENGSYVMIVEIALDARETTRRLRMFQITQEGSAVQIATREGIRDAWPGTGALTQIVILDSRNRWLRCRVSEGTWIDESLDWPAPRWPVVRRHDAQVMAVPGANAIIRAVPIIDDDDRPLYELQWPYGNAYETPHAPITASALLLCRGGKVLFARTADGVFQYDATTGRVVAKLGELPGPVPDAFALTPDADAVAIRESQPVMCAAWQCLGRPGVMSVDSRCERLLLVEPLPNASARRCVLWDVETGAALMKWSVSDPHLAWIVIDRDGNTLLYGYRDGQLVMRQIENAIARPGIGDAVDTNVTAMRMPDRVAGSDVTASCMLQDSGFGGAGARLLGTADGLLYQLSPNTDARQMRIVGSALGEIVTLAAAGHHAVAINRHGRCTVVDLRDPAVDQAVTFELGAPSDRAGKSKSDGLPADQITAAALGTIDDTRFMLAVGGTGVVEVWLLEMPTFPGEIAHSYMLGTLPVPDGNVVPAPILAIRWARPGDGRWQLIAERGGRAITQWTVLAGPPRVDADTATGEAWRRTIARMLGRGDTPGTSGTTPLSAEAWATLRMWVEGAE